MLSKENEKERDAFLYCEHVSKHYGGITALDDVSFSCEKGEIHVLIGENGAGKSTIIKILCGVAERDTGDIYMNGQKVKIDDSFDAEALGIAAVFQELSLIQDLSVAENIFLGHELTNRWGRIDFKKMYEETERFLGEIGIDLNPRQLVRNLSLCNQQMVEIAKALYKRPQVLILDEATSALGEKEVQWLFASIKKFAHEEGGTVIFISHRMDELEQVADRGTIFRDAHYITKFNWGELTNNQLVEYISGKPVDAAEVSRNKPLSDEVVLEVCGGSSTEMLHDINFSLRKGEILGVAGLSGHGQVQMLHALFGDNPFSGGTVKLEGKPVKLHNERQALKNGIVLVPEDRKHEGLMLERPISENITLMVLKEMAKLGVISAPVEKELLDKSVQDLRIKVGSLQNNANSLSGGNQQKLVIAKALLRDVKVLLLSDPTRGIDIGTKNEIYKLMQKLAAEGMSIIFMSTEVAELVQLCSRVLVFYEGSIEADLQDDEIAEDIILAHALGIAEEKKEGSA